MATDLDPTTTGITDYGTGTTSYDYNGDTLFDATTDLNAGTASIDTNGDGQMDQTIDLTKYYSGGQTDTDPTTTGITDYGSGTTTFDRNGDGTPDASTSTTGGRQAGSAIGGLDAKTVGIIGALAVVGLALGGS